MSTLLLRMAAPLQAWGTDSKFETRKTGREPSKSGVVGLVAAALGRRRDENIDDLNALFFGVRVDREGVLMRDFHTACINDKPAYTTTRYYLADAAFLVGLETADEAFLSKLEYALTHPAFPLFLGRRSCPPTVPLCMGIRPVCLEDALRNEPTVSGFGKKKEPAMEKRIVTDCRSGQPAQARVKDVANSFDPAYRRFSFRGVAERSLVIGGEKVPIEHDPMSELGE